MFAMPGLGASDKACGENEEPLRPKWPLSTSRAQAGQLAAK